MVEQALKDLSDLDLIVKYQKTRKNTLPQSLLLQRHKGLVYKYALKLFNEISDDPSITLEDIAQDFIEQLFEAFKWVDIKKIKNKNKFSSSGLIINRFNAYNKRIKSRYNKFHSEPPCFEVVEIKEEGRKITRSDIPMFFFVKYKEKFEQPFNFSLFLKEFENTLSEKEKLYWSYFIQGYKYHEISDILNVSIMHVYNVRNYVKNKYIRFFNLN